MVGRAADEVVLSDDERAFFQAQVRRHKAARSLSDRCRMILLCAEGLQSKEVGAQLGVHEHTVGKWRRRFVKDRIEGLSDECRPGRRALYQTMRWRRLSSGRLTGQRLPRPGFDHVGAPASHSMVHQRPRRSMSAEVRIL